MGKHGYYLIVENQDLVRSAFKSTGGCMVEVGSDRGLGSTINLAKMCKSMDQKFFTVDADPPTSDAAREIVKNVSEDFDAFCDFGENFMRNTTLNIGVAYLDAFDLQHVADTWRTPACPSPHDTYKKRNQKITNENSWKMHLECAKALSSKMKKGAVIFFDDTEATLEVWNGKGKTAVPFLLENGFKIALVDEDSVALVKE